MQYKMKSNKSFGITPTTANIFVCGKHYIKQHTFTHYENDLLSSLHLDFVWFYQHEEPRFIIMWISLGWKLSLCWQKLEPLQHHYQHDEHRILSQLHPRTRPPPERKRKEMLFLGMIWGNDASILYESLWVKIPWVLPVSKISNKHV